MQIEDTMRALNALKVTKITMTTDDKGQFAALADQKVQSSTGVTLMQHQCVGKTFEEAVEEVLYRANRAAVFAQAAVVRPSPRSN